MPRTFLHPTKTKQLSFLALKVCGSELIYKSYCKISKTGLQRQRHLLLEKTMLVNTNNSAFQTAQQHDPTRQWRQCSWEDRDTFSRRFPLVKLLLLFQIVWKFHSGFSTVMLLQATLKWKERKRKAPRQRQKRSACRVVSEMRTTCSVNGPRKAFRLDLPVTSLREWDAKRERYSPRARRYWPTQLGEAREVLSLTPGTFPLRVSSGTPNVCPWGYCGLLGEADTYTYKKYVK